MKFKRHVEFERGQLDIAPLIDVVFLLLIFFMLTSSFIAQPGIRVNLPKAVTSKMLEEENIVITITAQESIYLNNQPVSLNQLKSRLQKVKGKRPLLIKADSLTSLGKVVEVWDICREVGLTQINIATNQPAQ